MFASMTSGEPSARDYRDAQLATVLADAVRDGELEAVDALRVIRHEMRRRNTNRKNTLPHRSTNAQAVIDAYATRGEPVPKNSSNDALHADHVHPLTADDLHTNNTVTDWLNTLQRARTVVVVTAAENYALEQIERTGVTGPAKYEAAGITLAGNTAGLLPDL